MFDLADNVYYLCILNMSLFSVTKQHVTCHYMSMRLTSKYFLDVPPQVDGNI